MAKYILRRLLLGSLTLLLITLIVYALIRSMPGTPLTVAISEFDPSRKLDEADLRRMERAYGLDKPWPAAYVEWLSNTLRLDLGRSLSRRQSVAAMIRERIGPTLTITASSLCLTYLLSLPLGLYATARSGRWDQRALSTLLYMLYSFPAFVAALLLQSYLAVRLGWLPLMGMTNDNYADLTLSAKVWDIFLHALMPIFCFTYGLLAYYSRFVHANMEEVVRQDYIRTARAKGVPGHRILMHHALRNTLVPLVTLVGLTLPTLLSGAVILEQIFNWPGMGRLFFESIRERDYPTIMALTLVFSVLALVGQLLADILYAVVDPRISYS